MKTPETLRLVTDHVLAESQLDFRMDHQPAAEWPAVDRLTWEVRNSGSQAFHGVLRFEQPFPGAFRLPWVMVPGFLYGENRRLGPGMREGSYPRFDPAVSTPARMSSNH